MRSTGARPKILVSACLLGEPVRYDGRGKAARHPALARWLAEGRLVPICPELAGGLPVPRPPAEIARGEGRDVIAGTARVIEPDGRDVTDIYLEGARRALAAARSHGCRYAILTDESPSCGSIRIHDGGFAGRTRPGAGVTAEMFRATGIRVFAQTEIDALVECLVEG